MLLFPMFAAGAVADLGAVGGGDAGIGADDTGTGDAGSNAPLEDGSGDVPVDDGADTGQADVPEVAGAEAKTDGRTISPQLRKILADTKAANPEGYKQLKGVVFSEQAFRQQFPGGPTEAAALKTRLDEIGGFEAVEELQTEMQDYRGLDQQWLKGDPAFIQKAVATYPEGFKKLMPSMIQTFANVDKEGFNRELSKIMGATFDQAQLQQTIDWTKRLLSRSTDESAKEALSHLEGISTWIGGIRELANKAPALPQNDPKQQELTQREQTIQQREHQQFIGGLNREYLSYAGGKIASELKQLAPKGIPESASSKMVEQVTAELRDVLLKDRPFNAKYDNLCNAKDHEGALKLLKSKIEARTQRGTTLLADATKKVYRTWYGEPKLGTKPAAKPGQQPQAAAPKGWVRVGKAPTPDEVDSRASRGLLYNSQAVLKDGRKIYWGDKVPA